VTVSYSKYTLLYVHWKIYLLVRTNISILYVYITTIHHITHNFYTNSQCFNELYRNTMAVVTYLNNTYTVIKQNHTTTKLMMFIYCFLNSSQITFLDPISITTCLTMNID